MSLFVPFGFRPYSPTASDAAAIPTVNADAVPAGEGDDDMPFQKLILRVDAYGVHSGVTTLDGVLRSIYSEMYFLGWSSVFGGDIELLCDGTCTVNYGTN